MPYDNNWLEKHRACGAPDCQPVESAARTTVMIAEIVVCVSVLVAGFLFCWWWGGA